MHGLLKAPSLYDLCKILGIPKLGYHEDTKPVGCSQEAYSINGKLSCVGLILVLLALCNMFFGRSFFLPPSWQGC